MAIAEQFAGLKMDELIGGPLSAAADASSLLANSTADFINRIGFDRDGKVRTVAFSYQKRSINEDGTSNLEDMKVDVPMLAIVPIPNLQIDEVNVLFDMEVKQSEKSENSMDMGASVTGSLNLGIVKGSVTGSVSAHSSNTRSSDNSAKYHVDVRATNHGIPEGLARVLDMMAVNLSPALVGSTLKDGNGQNLSEAAKKRAESLKALRQEISQLETSVSACKESLDSNLKQMKRIVSSQLNVYQGEIHSLTNQLGKEDENGVEYSRAMDEVNQSWNTFQNQAGEFIYANAGHELPFIYRKAQGFLPYPIDSEIVLAGFEDTKYSQGMIKLEEGDKIFQYTDGVTEALNPSNTLYGMQRLECALNQVKEKNGKEIIQHIHSELLLFARDTPQADDITMLCLEFKKKYETKK